MCNDRNVKAITKAENIYKTKCIKSKVYKKLFDKFPVAAIITKDVLKSKEVMEEYKGQGLTCQWLDYKTITNWEYCY